MAVQRKTEEDLNKTEDFLILPGHINFQGLLMVNTSAPYMEKVMSFQAESNDVMVCTYPRSGTLLTSEILWHIKNLKNIMFNKVPGTASSRVALLEMNAWNIQNGLTMLEKQKIDNSASRLMKTHLTVNMLMNTSRLSSVTKTSPESPKIIVVIRNPKDVAVSLFHFYQGFPEFESWPYRNWDLFLNRFLKGQTMYNDIFEHHQQWWALKDDPNTCVFMYEEIVTDVPRAIHKMGKFLEESISTEQEAIIAHNVKIDTMSKNKDTNFVFPVSKATLIRKGKIGEWKAYFSEEQNALMDKLIAEKTSDIPYIFN